MDSRFCLFFLALSCFLSWGLSQEEELSQIARQMEEDVRVITQTIGERSPKTYEKLEKTLVYLEGRTRSKAWDSSRHTYRVEGQEYHNLVLEKKGKKKDAPIILLGAHYDTVPGTPGADDNASGVVVLMALSRMLADWSNEHPLRLVFFTLEEPPYFRTPDMGSTRYAKKMKKEREKVKWMISVDMVGYYSDERVQKISEHERAPADFIRLVSRPEDREIASRFAAYLEKHNAFPVKMFIAPPSVRGVDFSDHLSFWKYGYPASMLNDTVEERGNLHYHRSTDTLDIQIGRAHV